MRIALVLSLLAAFYLFIATAVGALYLVEPSWWPYVTPFVVAILGVTVVQARGTLLLALSRYREFAADHGSALLTGRPESLMSALVKLDGATEIPTTGRREALATLSRMGLRDALFGKKKLSEPKEDRLFALSTACVTLETELALRSAGAAAITFKPLSSGDFARVAGDVQSLVDALAKSSGSTIERKSDQYGYEWVIVRDPDFEDLVSAVHGVAAGLTEQGFGAQLLAAAFRFGGEARPVYWIYGFKRGAFWPFVPQADGKTRDNARELELKAKLEGELPIEQDLTRWLALFDAPI